MRGNSSEDLSLPDRIGGSEDGEPVANRGRHPARWLHLGVMDVCARKAMISTLVTMLVIGSVAAVACPTGLNVMPTADVLDAGALNIQLELTGETSPLDGERAWALLTQLGLPGRVEVGVDLEELQGDAQLLFDAKWQVIEESDISPAVALGLLDINRGSERGYYVAAARSIGDGTVRGHAGLLHTDAATAGMLGAEVEVAPCTVVMIDWITGPDGQTGLGVERALGAQYGLHLFFTADNATRGSSTSGVNLCWEGCW